MNLLPRATVRLLVLMSGAVLVFAMAAPVSARPAGHGRITVPGSFPTIQSAIDHAPPGATITIAPGTYVEEIVIDHDVTIRGSGIGATTITSPATLTTYGVHLPDSRALTAIVRVIDGARVSISDLSVEGPVPCGVEVSGIHVLQAATLDLSRARVTGIHADPGTCPAADAAGRAVVFGTPPHIEVDGQRGSTAFGRVRQVRIDDFQHAGISVAGPADGPRSAVTVAHTVVVGGWEIPSFQVGVWVDVSSVVDLHDNRISNVVCGGDGCGPDPVVEGQGIGVFLLSLAPGSRVVGNRIDGNDVGITQVFSPSCCVIGYNRLTDNRYFGIVVQDGDGSARANTITGGQVGVGVVADAADTTARLWANRIARTSEAKVREVECCGFTATAIVAPRWWSR